VDEIARYVCADTLGYLSIEGLYTALGEAREGFCDACFTGDYLLKFPETRPAAPLRLVGA
jgi:amidophosphoribosyltransferase